MNAKDKFILGFCRLGIAGLSPKAPGTCGTALALVFAPFLFLPFGLTGRVIFLLLLFVAGSLAASRGETLLGKKDPGEIVVDELEGIWIAVLPFAFSWTLFIAAFALFRFFDIRKPFPIYQSQFWLPAGWGVMIDDVIGGLMTMLCLMAAAFLGVLAWSIKKTRYARPVPYVPRRLRLVSLLRQAEQEKSFEGPTSYGR